MLVSENLQSEPSIKLRIIKPSPLKLPILIVLNQVVIRIPWESQWVESQRIDCGQLEQTHIRLGRRQVRQVERHQIVSE